MKTNIFTIRDKYLDHTVVMCGRKLRKPNHILNILYVPQLSRSSL